MGAIVSDGETNSVSDGETNILGNFTKTVVRKDCYLWSRSTILVNILAATAAHI